MFVLRPTACLTSQRRAALTMRAAVATRHATATRMPAARMPAAVQQRSMMGMGGMGGGAGDVDEMQMEREKKEWAAKSKGERRQVYLNKALQGGSFLGALALFEYVVCVADIQSWESLF
jgi:hypothetical protein